MIWVSIKLHLVVAGSRAIEEMCLLKWFLNFAKRICSCLSEETGFVPRTEV